VQRTYRRPSRRPLGTILGRVMVARLAYQALGCAAQHSSRGFDKVTRSWRTRRHQR
jgi:hypothetical protein